MMRQLTYCAAIFLWLAAIPALGRPGGALPIAERFSVTMTGEGYDPEIERAMLIVCGASSMEELDEELVERFMRLVRKPLDINAAGRAQMLGSGLFSSFQIASLMQWREDSGAILSLYEIAALDGFDKDYVDALSHFVTLASVAGGLPGRRRKKTLSEDLLIRNILKPGQWNYGLKSATDICGKAELDMAIRSTGAGTSPKPSDFCLSAAMGSFGHLDRLIVGDFNARYGQGLAMWSGFSLSGLGAPSSFAKRPQGITPLRSFTPGALTGAAAALSFGKVHIDMYEAVPEVRKFIAGKGNPAILGGANCSLHLRHGSVALNGWLQSPLPRGRPASASPYAASAASPPALSPAASRAASAESAAARLSADARFCIRGTDIWGEAAWSLPENRPLAVAGARVPLAGKWKASLAARYYPTGLSSQWTAGLRSSTKTSDEAGASLGIECGKMYLSADFAHRLSSGEQQLKLLYLGEWRLLGPFGVKTRLSGHLRSYGQRLRLDVRTDFSLNFEHWPSNLRINALHCAGWGFLGYGEQGYVARGTAVWLRACAFHVDRWDDRIYVYERDVGGVFNVPACYGRGLSASLMGRHAFNLGKGVLRLSLRAAVTAHFRSSLQWKAPKPELKFQIEWSL